jgi:FdhD protein
MRDLKGVRSAVVEKVRTTRRTTDQDLLVVEEPLEIRLGIDRNGKRSEKAVSITMRTPGHDYELAVGFLFNEGIIRSLEDLEQAPGTNAAENCNVVTVRLRKGLKMDMRRLLRHFYATSSCGVCGKASLQALEVQGCPVLRKSEPHIHAHTVHVLPEKLRAAQSVFDRTGALHAAGLFDAAGNLICVREDVGRHNAVDKLIGNQLMAGRTPLGDHLLMVSGRTSFEIIQKALMAGIAVVAAVSAPSSLAVDLADRFGMTLLGFVRGDNFNIYAGAQRILE